MLLCDQVAKKFVRGIERGRYLLPGPDIGQDWFIMEAGASWAPRGLPLLVSCLLAPLVPIAMYVCTILADRIARQHRHKRQAEKL